MCDRPAFRGAGLRHFGLESTGGADAAAILMTMWEQNVGLISHSSTLFSGQHDKTKTRITRKTTIDNKVGAALCQLGENGIPSKEQ